MKLIKLLNVFLIAVLASTVIGCGISNDKETKEDNKIIIGVSPTPHEKIIKNLDSKFKKEGLNVEIKVFDDYIQPNIALDSGDIDANYFQHKPYLDSFNKDHNFNNISLGSVHLEPLGLYSTKIKNINELKKGDEVLIPNDPSNGARALILLEKHGLIKLKDSNDLKATERDIIENPKNLKIVAMDAPTIPKAYVDAAAGVINSNYVIGAKIDPKSALIVEKGEGNPYANLIVIKDKNKNKEKFKKFIKIIQSDETKEFINKEFSGVIIPAFNK